MTEEEKKLELDKMFQELQEIDNKIYEQRTETLCKVEVLTSKTYREEVEECLEECESCGELSLIETKDLTGNRQSEEWSHFDHVYVDQTTNGGYTGDDFAGWFYIPITKNIYLKTYYSM